MAPFYSNFEKYHRHYLCCYTLFSGNFEQKHYQSLLPLDPEDDISNPYISFDEEEKEVQDEKTPNNSMGVPLSTSTPRTRTKLAATEAKRKLSFENADDTVNPNTFNDDKDNNEEVETIIQVRQELLEKIDQLNLRLIPDKCVFPPVGESFQIAILQQIRRQDVSPFMSHLMDDGKLENESTFMTSLSNYMKTSSEVADIKENFDPKDHPTVIDWEDLCEEILQPNNPDDVVIQCCARYLKMDIDVLDTRECQKTVGKPFLHFGGQRDLAEKIILGRNIKGEDFYQSLLPATREEDIQKSFPSNQQNDVPVTLQMLPSDNEAVDLRLPKSKKRRKITGDVNSSDDESRMRAVTWNNYDDIPEEENVCYVLSPVDLPGNRVLPDKPARLYKWSKADNSGKWQKHGKPRNM